MGTLVVARGQRSMDAVVTVLRGDGYEAMGTTTDDEALARLQAGGITALVIGGGVEQASREKLQRAATAQDATVVAGALGSRDVQTYVRQDLEPQLASIAGPT